MGCSNVEFDEIPQTEYYANCVLRKDLGSRCTYSGAADLGKVDILFVNDNSGSMSTEQNKMADKFTNFISTLDSQRIDYQIAITTTDISGDVVATRSNGSTYTAYTNGPTPWNGNGALQDGKFIAFPNGSKILKKSMSTSTKINYFAQTIKRPETLHCEDSDFEECPSGDERGIYAINKVLDRADPDFFRKDSHFAVVILSDEDERSTGGSPLQSGQTLELEPEDTPEYLVSRLSSTLGPTKAMSVHSIVVKPGDSNCKYTQSNQGNGINGEYGTYYSKLSNPSFELKSLGNIVDGKLGNICSSSYTSQLVDMASKISTSSFSFALPCDPVDDYTASQEGFDPVEIHVSPDPGFQVNYSVDSNNNLTFYPSIPAGSRVEYTVVCKKK